MDARSLSAVSFEEVRLGVRRFGELVPAGGSGDALRAATGDHVDLAIAAHRRALHRWLNAWGCRIRYSRAGEPDLFDAGIHRWWRRHGPGLEQIHRTLSDLTDADVDVFADAFGALSGTPIARTPQGTHRTMGPTAAAKGLHALRPCAVMPWDLMIATRLHGRRDAAAFAAHLRLGRAWSQELLRSTGWDEARLASELGQPMAGLARLLDQYCYVRFTVGDGSPLVGTA